MGRALVREPKAFLLDEPLSNLDAKLRVQMRAELKRLHQHLGVTTIYVTHDQVEAMTLGDRIAVLSGGRLQQLGPPQEVYDHPANVFVAGFIGSPPMNLLSATAVSGTITAGDLQLDIPGVADGEVVVGIRPEALRPAGDGLPSVPFTVDVVEPLGDEIVVHGSVAGRPAEGELEEQIPLSGSQPARATITARFDPQLRPRVGEQVPLRISPDAVHVFDAATGEALR
jgi:multiple sugar transport system ATP-binding protein